MRAFAVVGGEPCVERLLHLVDGLEPGLSALDAEVLVQHLAVDALGAPRIAAGGAIPGRRRRRSTRSGPITGPRTTRWT